MRVAVILPSEPGFEIVHLLGILARANARADAPLEITAFSTCELEVCEHFECVCLTLPEKEGFVDKLAAIFAQNKLGGYVKILREALKGREFDRLIVIDELGLCEPIARTLKLNPCFMARRDCFSENRSAKGAFRVIKRFILPSVALKSVAMTPDERTSVVYDSPELAPIDLSRRDEVRTRLSLEGEVVLLIGDADGGSGALECAKAIVSSSHPKATLLIRGECVDEDYAHLLEISDAKLAFAKDEPLENCLAAADIAVFPATREEYSGLYLLEALAAGLPTAAGDQSAYLEYALHFADEYSLDGGSVATANRGLGYVNSLSKTIDGVLERPRRNPIAASAERMYTELRAAIE